MHSLIPNSLYKARDAVQSNLNHAYGAIQSYIFTKNPDDIRLRGSVNTKRPKMSGKQIAAKYQKSVEGNPDIDANRIKAREKSEAEKRESDKLEHSLPILSERQQRQPEKTAQSSPESLSAKRMVEDTSTTNTWQRLEARYRASDVGIRHTWRMLNGVYSASENDPDSPGLFVDYTKEPFEYADLFSFPVLVDERIRARDLNAFKIIANGLSKSTSLEKAPEGYEADIIEVIRETVPVMVKESWDCMPHIFNSIASFHPASCASFQAGDLIAQIDEFFSVNRTNQNVGGAVFVDPVTIERWVKESRFLQESEGQTAIAIRIIEFNKEQIIVLSIIVPAFPLSVAIICMCAKKEQVKKLLDKIKDKFASIKLCPPRQADISAQTTNFEPHNDQITDLAGKEGAESESRSDYLGDFSSSDEGEVELQAISVTAKTTTNATTGGRPRDEASSEVV